MNWQEVKSPEHRGLTVWFTNDQPFTDFSISEHKYVCRVAIHTQTKRDGEFLGVVFNTVQEAKDYVAELDKFENRPLSDRLWELVNSIGTSARPMGEREASSGLG